MINILDMELAELKNWMKEQGESEFRAKQVFDWIYKDVWNFDEMNNISSGAREKLKKYFYFSIPEVERMQSSAQKDTIKFLFKYRDGNLIETVLMKYIHGYSICVSTQVGCRMGCKFCASTVDGMIRNLTSGEILGQILKVQQEVKIKVSNVVLMGSGEPFDNIDNVIKFIHAINSKEGLNIGQRHITLSTCGIVPKIKELADMKLQITLAISLHASDDSTRKQMMPIANKYSISELLESCRYYIEKTNKRITFEYALVSGVNDSVEAAEKLAGLLSGMLCHVNLIPVNEIRENNFKKASSGNINKFMNILGTKGIETTIRREMGADIDAACGQLRRRHLNNC